MKSKTRDRFLLLIEGLIHNPVPKRNSELLLHLLKMVIVFSTKVLNCNLYNFETGTGTIGLIKMETFRFRKIVKA